MPLLQAFVAGVLFGNTVNIQTDPPSSKMKLKVPYKCMYHPRIWKLFWNSHIEEMFDLMSKHWLVFFDQTNPLQSGQYRSHCVLQEFIWQDWTILIISSLISEDRSDIHIHLYQLIYPIYSLKIHLKSLKKSYIVHFNVVMSLSMFTSNI